MLRKAQLDTMLRNKLVAGVEYVFADDSCTINLVLLKKQGSALQTQLALTGMKNMAELRAHVPPDIPVNLVINGKGVLHKKAAVQDTDTGKALLQKVLPNANADEFYIQKTTLGNEAAYISVARKQSLNELFGELQQNGIHVNSCSFGPFCILGVIPLLENADSSVYWDLSFSNHKLTVSNKQVENYQVLAIPAENSIRIGTEEVKAQSMLSFAAAFQYFIPDSVKADIPALDDAGEEFRQKRIFKLAGWTILIAFLGLLLANFVLFDYYSGKRNDLSTKMALNKDWILKYDTLSKEVATKEAFFEKTGLLETSRASFYADQLAIDLPVSIQLRELLIHPPEKKLNHEEEISFRNNAIMVSGICKKNTELNEWIKTLKDKPWVLQLNILNYSYDKTQEAGEFIIELTTE